jgi:hypothetical protein
MPGQPQCHRRSSVPVLRASLVPDRQQRVAVWLIHHELLLLGRGMARAAGTTYVARAWRR